MRTSWISTAPALRTNSPSGPLGSTFATLKPGEVGSRPSARSQRPETVTGWPLPSISTPGLPTPIISRAGTCGGGVTGGGRHDAGGGVTGGVSGGGWGAGAGT
jgi:hypothetical protein